MTAKQIFDTLNQAKEQKGAKLKHLPIYRESYVRFEKTGGITLTSLIQLAEYLGYSVELTKNNPCTQLFHSRRRRGDRTLRRF